MEGEPLLQPAYVSDLLEVGIHLLVGEDGEKLPVLGSSTRAILLDDGLGDVQEEDVTLYSCLLSPRHDPCLSIHSNEVFSSEVCDINIGKSREAGEEKEVTDEREARDGQLLVGYLQDLFVGEEASVYRGEVEVVIAKRILEKIAPLEGIDSDGLQGLHLLDSGIVGT